MPHYASGSNFPIRTGNGCCLTVPHIVVSRLAIAQDDTPSALHLLRGMASSVIELDGAAARLKAKLAADRYVNIVRLSVA